MEPRGDYEYENEGVIADELKCSICHRPFESPVDTHICEHTFCRSCITTWISAQQTCPTCRRRVVISDLRPVSSRIVLGLLGRIPVRCTGCHEGNIQRGNFNDHKERCSARSVPCPFADLSCPWTGKFDELCQHERTCPYRSVRPIVDELRGQNKQLQQTVQKQAEQIRYLVLLLNNGQPMGLNCVREDYCRVFCVSSGEPEEPTCSMCRCSTSPFHIAYHHCDGGCICTTCSRLYDP